MSISRYCLRRLALMPPMLLGIIALAFLLLKLAPGDPIMQRLTDVDPGQRDSVERRLRERYQLDEPLIEQFGAFLGRSVRLDLRYFADDRPIWKDLAVSLPVTLLINGLAVLLIYGFGIPVGLVGALWPDSRYVRVLSVLLMVAYSVPAFWVAELLRTNFGDSGQGWFPVMGLASDHAADWSWTAQAWDRALHLILPIVCLSYGGVAYVGQQVRAGLLEVRDQNFVRALRARGASEWQIWTRHVLPNGLFPLLTSLGHVLPFLVAGSVVIETIFNLPGMGRLAMNAMMSREYDLILGILMLSAALTLLSMLAVDICYAMLNPRVRFEQSK